VDEGIEFLIVTQWESFDAIRQFAGQDFEQAVVPEIAQRMLVSYDQKVRHYEVYFTTMPQSSG
jgi:heme-degrading monooxygenase HmoA